MNFILNIYLDHRLLLLIGVHENFHKKLEH
jgi:hypothetical protein